MKNQLKNLYRCTLVFSIVCLCAVTAYAEGLMDSKIVVGGQRLLDDVGTVIMIVGPVICGIVAGYYAVRRSASDEPDGKSWEKRIRVAIICGVGIGLLGGLINIIASYFK